jgi:GWxTD domain-containing protein
MALGFHKSGRLNRGSKVGITYNLDVSDFPPGVYQLSCAPLGSAGRTWLTEFTVCWSLNPPVRGADEGLGIARLLLSAQEFSIYAAAAPSTRAAMLQDYWAARDPDPDTPLNEVHIEFQRRLAHLRRYWGGFDQNGRIDPRGEVYLLLGPPDVVTIEDPPSVEVSVAEVTLGGYRDEALAAGEPKHGRSYGEVAKTARRGVRDARLFALPSLYSFSTRRIQTSRREGKLRMPAFEQWEYHHGGRSLFTNRYSETPRELHFTFTYRPERGGYILQGEKVFR